MLDADDLLTSWSRALPGRRRGRLYDRCHAEPRCHRLGATPTTGGNAGNVTVEIDGTNLAATDTVSLTSGSTTIDASAIDFVERQPDLRHVQPVRAKTGDYTVRVQQGTDSITAQTPFQVVAASPGDTRREPQCAAVCALGPDRNHRHRLLEPE